MDKLDNQIGSPRARGTDGLVPTRRLQFTFHAGHPRIVEANTLRPSLGNATGISSNPGGMFDNSPTFQRWVRSFRLTSVPKGRLTSCPSFSRPFGTTHASNESPNAEALGYSRMSLPGQDSTLAMACCARGWAQVRWYCRDALVPKVVQTLSLLFPTLSD